MIYDEQIQRLQKHLRADFNLDQLKADLEKVVKETKIIEACDESLRHYKETGLHLSDEETSAWLKRVDDTGVWEEAPECHI